MGLAVLAGVAAFVLNYTELGTAILGHVGMFYGSNAIDTVRAAMMDASFRIAAEHFPLGTGGGTFGSVGSILFGYSQLYYDYGIICFGEEARKCRNSSRMRAGQS